MGNLVKVVQEAPAHHTFPPGAFDSQIGETFPLTVEGRRIDNCKVVSAEVSEDGSSATLTFEVPDGILPAHPLSVSVHED